jgi:uncharacterized LabA/DUF88 family protein
LGVNNELDNKRFIYIDGANLDKSTNELGWKIDYHRFFVWLKDRFRFYRAYIFIGYLARYENLYMKMRAAGFALIFKDVTSDSHGKIKGNCDADLVMYIMRDLYENRLTIAVIVSSDGDFSGVINFLIAKGVVVEVVSPSSRCSFLLRKINIPINYLGVQRDYISLL